MHQCSKGCKWTGLSAAHCGSCHHTFGSVNYFDRHRKNGECRHPTEQPGLSLSTRGVWRMPYFVEAFENTDCA